MLAYVLPCEYRLILLPTGPAPQQHVIHLLPQSGNLNPWIAIDTLRLSLLDAIARLSSMPRDLDWVVGRPSHQDQDLLQEPRAEALGIRQQRVGNLSEASKLSFLWASQQFDYVTLPRVLEQPHRCLRYCEDQREHSSIITTFYLIRVGLQGELSLCASLSVL